MTQYEVGQVYHASNDLPLQIMHVEQVNKDVLAIHIAYWTPDNRVMFAILSPEALDAEPLELWSNSSISRDLASESLQHASYEGDGRGVFTIPPRELLKILAIMPTPLGNYHPYPVSSLAL